MDYNESLEYLHEQQRFGIKPGLERIRLLLGKIGNPQEGMTFVHISGTNGKGSVTSMITNVFKTAGLKTGEFTSPHLERYNERININGHDVSDEGFAEAITIVKQAADSIKDEELMPTQFEILTAAAFYLFKEAELDIVVLEVGMGGLFDSTNVITPECSIITNIGMDHTDYFGDTLEDIARQKAGIIKEGIPVVTAAESVALNILVDKAAPLKAELYVFRIDFTAIAMGGDISRQKFMFRKGDFVATFEVALGGDHQVANAALVVMAARLLSDKHPEITVAAIQEGLSTVKWPGRLELLQSQPDIILDGAHNLQGAIALRTALDKYRPNQSITFVLGIMKDKDITGIVDTLVTSNDTLIATRADLSERAAVPDDIVKVSKGNNIVCENLEEAIAAAKKAAGNNGCICVAGSLYLVGRAKHIFPGSVC